MRVYKSPGAKDGGLTGGGGRKTKGGAKVETEGRKTAGVDEWARKSDEIAAMGKLENRGTRRWQTGKEVGKERQREGGRMERGILGDATKGAHPPGGAASSQPLFNVFN